MPNNRETKSNRFVRVAERRTNAILEKLRILGNCSNKSMYEYSEEDVDKIFRALNKALKDTKSLFDQKTDQRFKLSTR